MGFSPCSYHEHILFIRRPCTLSLSNGPVLSATLSFLSSRGADLPAASQEWNERVDIELLPTHERSCFVSGHDFSRAAHQPSTMGFSPCSYLEHILFIRSVPGFHTSPPSPVPLMWFSLKRTTCSWPKPQVSTGNLGEPTCPGVPWRDLQFRGPLLETRNDKGEVGF